VATEEEIAAALALRASRRAYDGAPPRVPHPVVQTGELDCVACHQNGAVVEGRVAAIMSHETYSSCSQCHVADVHPMPSAERALLDGPPIDTRFVGLEPPTVGPRAWEGAPPVIPHPTQMRERCESCHGVLAEGLRTSHPWRQSCTQCHAPSAEMDVRPMAELPSIVAAP
jgi:cytochrome c-type protein NapB